MNRLCGGRVLAACRDVAHAVALVLELPAERLPATALAVARRRRQCRGERRQRGRDVRAEARVSPRGLDGGTHGQCASAEGAEDRTGVATSTVGAVLIHAE